jgi:hypothetical protein
MHCKVVHEANRDLAGDSSPHHSTAADQRQVSFCLRTGSANREGIDHSERARALQARCSSLRPPYAWRLVMLLASPPGRLGSPDSHADTVSLFSC